MLALSEPGPERTSLLELSQALVQIQMSSLAWYEFCRGPRTPQQLAVGRSFLTSDGIVPLTEEIAFHAGEVFGGWAHRGEELGTSWLGSRLPWREPSS